MPFVGRVAEPPPASASLATDLESLRERAYEGAAYLEATVTTVCRVRPEWEHIYLEQTACTVASEGAPEIQAQVIELLKSATDQPHALHELGHRMLGLATPTRPSARRATTARSRPHIRSSLSAGRPRAVASAGRREGDSGDDSGDSPSPDDDGEPPRRRSRRSHQLELFPDLGVAELRRGRRRRVRSPRPSSIHPGQLQLPGFSARHLLGLRPSAPTGPGALLADLVLRTGLRPEHYAVAAALCVALDRQAAENHRGGGTDRESARRLLSTKEVAA